MDERDRQLREAYDAGMTNGVEMPASIADDLELRHEFERGRRRLGMLMSDSSDVEDFVDAEQRRLI